MPWSDFKALERYRNSSNKLFAFCASTMEPELSNDSDSIWVLLLLFRSFLLRLCISSGQTLFPTSGQLPPGWALTLTGTLFLEHPHACPDQNGVTIVDIPATSVMIFGGVSADPKATATSLRHIRQMSAGAVASNYSFNQGVPATTEAD